MSSEQTKPTAPEFPLYNGSCHCGYITYAARLNLRDASLSSESPFCLTRCNCSICHKAGYLAATCQPASSLSILTPKEGEAGISDYAFGQGTIHHWFCPKCGIRCFYGGSYISEKGETVHFKRVNALTLDGRADGQPLEDLRALKTGYTEMKSPEGWRKGIASQPWDGGVW